MERPSYLSKYLFDWQLLDVIIGGKSPLDSKVFVGASIDKEQVYSFLHTYGLSPEDPVSKAEIFGNFQEALQFIKRYFLKEGNPDGLDIKIPNSLYMINEISDLFLMASVNSSNIEEQLWAEVIFKVMHTILHADKDLRSNYFSVIQTQIFDKFYKYISRDNNQKLVLGKTSSGVGISLVDFQTKAKKTRNSIIIKLLHKTENVAEELFDRIGVRIVTEDRFSALRAVKFLIEESVIIPHNVKSSRSVNTLVDVSKFRTKHNNLVKMALRNNLAEDRFVSALEREADDCPGSPIGPSERNVHSAKGYKTIQFTCRQLIKYRNPFYGEFNSLRKLAKSQPEESELTKKILSLDISLISRDIRFFYPFEVQVVDQESHKRNTGGDASYQEYKKAQLKSAMHRIFKPLMELNNITAT
ncbi:MAG: TIGR04552 family protein [Bacteriovoracaceae bacterium]|nr:TIGR04552 family protein [Bacteriovoracaceae bacterium]